MGDAVTKSTLKGIIIIASTKVDEPVVYTTSSQLETATVLAYTPVWSSSTVSISSHKVGDIPEYIKH